MYKKLFIRQKKQLTSDPCHVSIELTCQFAVGLGDDIFETLDEEIE